VADSKRTHNLPAGFQQLSQGDPGKNNGLTGIVLRGSDGFDRALWVDTTGDLRIADVDAVEAADFDPDTAGAVVGGQS
jgi:hypothetical protein